jgi:hypothetical protein
VISAWLTLLDQSVAVLAPCVRNHFAPYLFDACNFCFDLIFLPRSLLYRMGAPPFSRLRLYM